MEKNCFILPDEIAGQIIFNLWHGNEIIFQSNNSYDVARWANDNGFTIVA
jgi:hypothetical protein